MTSSSNDHSGSPGANAYQGPWAEGRDDRAKIRLCATRFEAAMGAFAGVMLVQGLAYLATLLIKAPTGLLAGLSWIQNVLIWVAVVMAITAGVLGVRLQMAISTHAQEIARDVRSRTDV
jgi:hypothetical protein